MFVVCYEAKVQGAKVIKFSKQLITISHITIFQRFLAHRYESIIVLVILQF
jgi:hypothetical protein